MSIAGNDPLSATKNLPDDWDPAEDARVYYRDTQTGDLGWLVKRGGKTMVKLDRPMQDLVRPFRKTVWQADAQHRPLTKHQVTRVAFEADKMLCLALGMHSKAKAEWESLTDQQRIEWVEQGPSDRVERVRLYRGVMSAMAPLMK